MDDLQINQLNQQISDGNPAVAAAVEHPLDGQRQRSPTPPQSLLQRRSPLADPQQQQALLNQLDLTHTLHHGDFQQALGQQGWPELQTAQVEIVQINVGKLCNMTCRHCHVDAGPDRREIMDQATMDACLHLLDHSTAHTVDITGGAPELNPQFRYLVDQCVARGKHVIDRCNLTVLLLPTLEDLPQWLGDRGVEIVCSLPHYRQRNTDAQRGDGTFEKSILALQKLNAAGYGQGDPQRRLTLVSNPVGAFLAANQARLQQEWQAGLQKHHSITFDRLILLNNMPISRYLEWLEASGNLAAYMERLVNAFNPATIDGLMCRHTLSISWDGQIFDCDFNQMLDLPARSPSGDRLSVHNLTPDQLLARPISTGRHCFGCTAGSGSSCGGALAEG